MSDMIEKYIAKHSSVSDRICIFKDSTAFLEMLFENGAAVEMIVWYDRCLISEQKDSLGSGGYTDKTDKSYMFAETAIFETGLKDKTMGEILTYIEKVREKYKDHDLYPEFYL